MAYARVVTLTAAFAERNFIMSTQLRGMTRWPDRVGEIDRRSLMPLLGAGAVLLTLARNAHAQQIPFPQTAAEVPGPVPGTAMTIEYVQMVGRTSYFWGYPLVATSNRRAAFAKAPERILLGGVIPMAPVGYNTMLTGYIKPDEDFIVCPNQDVVYGGGFTALDLEHRRLLVQRGKAAAVHHILVGTDDEVFIRLDIAGQHRVVANRGKGYDPAKEDALGRLGERRATIARGDQWVAPEVGCASDHPDIVRGHRGAGHRSGNFGGSLRKWDLLSLNVTGLHRRDDDRSQQPEPHPAIHVQCPFASIA